MITALFINRLTVRIDTEVILREVDLSINKGDQVAIIGPNGSGKSTLLNAILNLIPNEVNILEVFGQDLRSLSRKTIARLISHIPQQQLVDEYLTPFAWCEMARFPHQQWGFGLTDHELDVIHNALKITHTSHLKDRRMDQLSGGERQRVYIAGSLCQETPIIFLDEPCSFLDPKYAKEITSLIHQIACEQQKTIVCVTHDLNQIRSNFTHVLGMKSGEVMFYGEVDKMLTAAYLSDLFDYSFRIATYQNQEIFF